MVRLRLHDTQLAVHLTFARREVESLVRIDSDQDGVVSPAELATAQPSLQALGRTLIEIHASGERLVARETAVELDTSEALHFRFDVPWPTGARLMVSAPVIGKLARGHRQYVTVRDQDGQDIASYLLDAEHDGFTLLQADASTAVTTPPSLGQFLILGVEHILTGYDHLLFLFGLLVVGGSLRSAWRIITSFTLAHSITLALATLDVVRLPSSLVEPLIAVSIIYVGLENLWRRDLHRRWLLTFAFGLVHGLGFASVLRDLGIGMIDGVGVIVPLVAFNSGVELGQLAVAALILPLMWNGQRRPAFPRFAMMCSILITLAGTYWLCERTGLFGR
jgi:hydrogenase/urease accessory protein HupE